MQLAIDFFIQIFFYKIRQDAKNINYNQLIFVYMYYSIFIKVFQFLFLRLIFC